MKSLHSDSTEASADSTTDSLHRPRRSCRQHTNALIEEQLLEEIEDRRVLQDQRTNRLKEKNKRAQQRFRERQKEKSQQAVVQVQRLQQQIAELRAHAATTTDRCQLLEKLLAIKDAKAGSIEDHMMSGHRASPQDATSIQIFAPYGGFSALPEKEFVMCLRYCSHISPLHVTREQVQAMGLKEHTQRWQVYVEQMGAALQEVGNELNSPAARHLQGLTNELFAWSVWVNIVNPQILPKMRRMNMDTLSIAGQPNPHIQLSALKSQGLSREQMQQMVAARRFCLANLASLMRERLSMQDTLRSVIEGGSSWNNMYDSHPTMVEMQERLARNVEAESHAFHTFMTSALRRVLNPVQAATLLVQSYPYMPNLMGVVACLSSEETDEGSDDDLLELDQVPLNESPATTLALPPADSLGMSLDALWNDIYLN